MFSHLPLLFLRKIAFHFLLATFFGVFCFHSAAFFRTTNLLQDDVESGFNSSYVESQPQLINIGLIEDKFIKFSVNNTVFVTICNKGMAIEWLQQWYVSARRAGIRNVMVIATDSATYEWAATRLGERVLRAEELTPLLTSNRWNEHEKSESIAMHAHNWRTNGYEQIVVQRATIIASILEKTSVDIVYADTDIHWFRNPQDLLWNVYSKFHFCLQREKGDELGDYNCSGFMYFRNSPQTLQFVKAWENYIRQRLLKKGFFTDQEEINKLLREIAYKHSSRYIGNSLKGLNACTFNWDEFPSGVNYFKIREKGNGKITTTCQSKVCKYNIWNKQRKKGSIDINAYLVHHNYAKSNREKQIRAKKYGLWLTLEPADWNK